MIKKIHYFWFGRNPLSEKVKKCITSWKEKMPEFEIIEWNEDNFDFSDCEFAKNAYENKKWAFVSDYARAKVLYDYGGIVLDTDVELLKPLDDLLNNSFMGFENNNFVNPGLVLYAKESKLNFFAEIADVYKNTAFDVNNLNSITSPIMYTNLLLKKGLVLNNELQTVDGFIIYPTRYFNPMGMHINTVANITENTYSIHHYDATWFTEEDTFYRNFLRKYGAKKGKILFCVCHPIKALKRARKKRKI